MIMSIEDDKAVAGRWFTEFWDADFAAKFRRPSLTWPLAAPPT
jgi:hypothetical protein